MTEPALRIDPLTGAYVVVTPWRQHRPNLPDGICPFCPGGLEAPGTYDVRWIPNRWPALPDGRHEVILHTPDHKGSYPSLGDEGAARVVEMWSRRTGVLGARDDVRYVFVLESSGREIGSTIEHPHSQIMGFGMVPPLAMAELAAGECLLCREPEPDLIVAGRRGWRAHVPWAPSWPYELLIAPAAHVPDLPESGPAGWAGLGAMLVDCLSRVERVFGAGAPYMLWLHQRPTDGQAWPGAHLHAHLAPVLRDRGVRRHLAAAELGAGVFFDPVDPRDAAARLREAG